MRVPYSQPTVDNHIELVTVASYLHPWEAHHARTRLEAYGLTAFVENEHASLYPTLDATGSVQLRIPSDQVERAVEILARTSASEPDEKDHAGSQYRGPALAILLIIALTTLWQWVRALLG